MHEPIAPGTEVGGFVAGDMVGVGGASTVQRAWDPRIGRAVALKVLDVGAAWDPAIRERFEREVRMGGGLTHPNIVPVLDAGEWQGRPYIVMQLIEGPTLASVIAHGGPLPYARAVAIASDVAAALDFAHQRGIVHRDVKPGNVLVLEGGGAGGSDHAYLADFGITRAMHEAELARGNQRVLGTPAYIAPEQLAGGPVDGRADIYALACVVHEMLTGAPPRVGARIDLARPDIPPPAVAALRQALSPEPGMRPPTAGALVAGLGVTAVGGATLQMAAGGPTTALPWIGQPTMDIPITRTTTSNRPRRRNGALVALFAGVFLITTLGLVAMSGLGSDPTTDPPPTTTGANETAGPTKTRQPGRTPSATKDGGSLATPDPGTSLAGAAAERALRRAIPRPIEDAGCFPYTFTPGIDWGPMPEGTVALTCIDPEGVTKELRYYRFPDAGSLQAYWDERMSEFSFDGNDLGCWLQDDGVTPHTRGQVECDSPSSSIKRMRWTDDERQVLGFLEAADDVYWPRTIQFFRTEAVAGGTSPVFSQRERDILERFVPSRFHEFCAPYPPDAGSIAVEGAIAAVDCLPWAVEELFYFQLDDDVDAEAAFQRRIDRDPVPRAPGTGCEDGRPGDAEWARGPLFCWVQDAGVVPDRPEARLRWLDTRDRIFGGVNANDGVTDIGWLHDWWQDNAWP